MIAPVATPAEVTHDAVTSAMLRHRRVLATLLLLALAAVSFWVVVALVRARTQPTLGVQMSRGGGTLLRRPDDRTEVMVRAVRAQGAAADAGLRAGDRVLRIDGIAVADTRALTLRHDRLQPGEVIPFEVEREGQRLTRQVTTGRVLEGRWQWTGIAGRVFLVFTLFLGIPSIVFK